MDQEQNHSNGTGENQQQHPYGNPTNLNATVDEQKTSTDWAQGSEEYIRKEETTHSQGYDGKVYNNPNINKASTFSQQNAQNNNYSQDYEENKNGNGFAVASLVLGIISLVIFCVGFNIILAILAIVFGAVALHKCNKKGMAIAGIVTGIVSIALFLVVCLVIGASFMSVINEGGFEDFDDLYNYYNNGGNIDEMPGYDDIEEYDGNTVNYEFNSNGEAYTVYFD
ncbi:DUF4190 domain-containing protein [Eubacterium oxidoreducens]|uniref:DUF4190 domain-containing protein n=1 Tax=Eubacterium oxidoreducens TaxID=1732 RepID=A0A1G6AGA8_EUBOX|nr:DUF4190 domain-containing protein [Eubacterium oxidoreducens]SDB07448.1 protein of unknown function [Eubacterium oxidoreducens]